MLTDVVIANKSYTKLNITDKDNVDQIALKVMKQDCPDFLLPIKTMEIDNELEIRYELQDGVRLSYSPTQMSRKEFTVLLKNMLEPFQNCSDWFLDYHNILLEPEHILIGRSGMTVKYLYLPAAEYIQSDKKIAEFFYDYIVQSDVTDDPRYTTNLLRILKRDGSNLMTLLEYLTQETPADEKKPAAAEVSGKNPRSFADSESPAPKNNLLTTAGTAVQNVQQNKPVSAARPGQMTREFGKQDIEGSLMGSLFGEEETAEEKGSRGKAAAHKDKTQKSTEKPQKSSGGIFGMFKGNPKNTGKSEKEKLQTEASPVFRPSAPAEVPASGGSGNHMPINYEDDRTEILAEEVSFDPNILKFSLENNAGRDDCPLHIEIDLVRGFATVGRTDKSGRNQSDYNFPPSFTFISRRHFRVEKNQTEWKIIDLGSANGTFVNGQALVPNIPYPLHSGDTVMISQQHRLTYRVC